MNYCKILISTVSLFYILQASTISTNYNYKGMIIRNFLLKQYLQVPVLNKINKHFLKECKEKIVNLYYNLPHKYYTLSEDDKLLIENILGTLI